MPPKIRHEIDLRTPVRLESPRVGTLRTVSRHDLHGLAGLMLDSYRGTIDYEGEDLDDAVAEVRSFFDGPDPLPKRSHAVELGGEIISAVLVRLVEGDPFIGYVMTRAAHKGQGLGRAVTTAALSDLAQDGYAKVVLYITEGNEPSEGLFASLGAEPVKQ